MLRPALLGCVWAVLAAKALGGRVLAWRQCRRGRSEYERARQGWERISSRAMADCPAPETPSEAGEAWLAGRVWR